MVTHIMRYTLTRRTCALVFYSFASHHSSRFQLGKEPESRRGFTHSPFNFQTAGAQSQTQPPIDAAAVIAPSEVADEGARLNSRGPPSLSARPGSPWCVSIHRLVPSTPCALPRALGWARPGRETRRHKDRQPGQLLAKPTKRKRSRPVVGLLPCLTTRRCG
eukprot:COSAG01_NODE_8454_length_2780_cov_13.679597_1_plen_162_part_00